MENGLTLNGRLTLTRSGYYDFRRSLNFPGDQTLTGAGEVLFVQSGSRANSDFTNYLRPARRAER